MDAEFKKQVLTSSLQARVKEVDEYQINIDNFRLAIERIGEDKYLRPFKEQLTSLLEGHLYEQRKAQIMLEVIQSQLEG